MTQFSNAGKEIGNTTSFAYYNPYYNPYCYQGPIYSVGNILNNDYKDINIRSEILAPNIEKNAGVNDCDESCNLGSNMEDNYEIPHNVDDTPKIEHKLIVSINFNSGMRALSDKGKKLHEETVVMAEVVPEIPIDAIVVNNNDAIVVNSNAIVVKNNDSTIKCCFNNCEKIFTDITSIRNHIKLHLKSYRCPEEHCNKPCKTYRDFVHHIAKHDGKYASYSCNICNKEIVGLSNYSKHIKNHEEAVYKCTTMGCRKQFFTISKWISHIGTHGFEEWDDSDDYNNKPLPYICPYNCGKSFNSMRGMKIHSSVHRE